MIALTVAALTSSVARTAGRRTRMAMALSDPDDEGPPYYRAEQDLDEYPEEQGAPIYAGEVEQAPRWMLVLAILSGAGLLLGLLLVMIASIP
jgi:hypothetical protein